MGSGSAQDFGCGRTDLSGDSRGGPQWPLPVAAWGMGVNRCPLLRLTPDLCHKRALMPFRGYSGICLHAAGASLVTNEGVEVTFPQQQLLSPPCSPPAGTA